MIVDNDPPPLKGLMWSNRLEKHLPQGGQRASLLQVVPVLLRPRGLPTAETIHARSSNGEFEAGLDATRCPPTESCDLSGTQPIRGQQQEHRIVTKADRTTILSRAPEHRLYLFFAEGARNLFE